jgi:hypothetical protein
MSADEQHFVVREVGQVRETANGNRYLTCRTDIGRVAFWGSVGNQKNIRQIEQCTPPVGVRAGSIPSRWAQHALWVPQTARVQFTKTAGAGDERQKDTKGSRRDAGKDSEGRALDPHVVLGVAKGASRVQIRTAYRELVKQYHPDHVARLGQELKDLAHRKTQEINWAYETLALGKKKGPA